MGKLIGVDDSILFDPRVQEALGVVEKGIDPIAAKALTDDPKARLSAHGLTLRVSGLQHKALIQRIMYACPSSAKPKLNEDLSPVTEGGKPVMETTADIPSILQTFWWLYTLAAPQVEVMAAITQLERTGIDSFMERVDAWFAVKGLTGGALQDVVMAMGEEMSATAKLAPPSADSAPGEIKNG